MYRDNLSCEKAAAIFKQEGAHWEDQKDGFSSYLVSNKTGEHLAAVWDSNQFWTWRVGGHNNSADSMKSAKKFTEECLSEA